MLDHAIQRLFKEAMLRLSRLPKPPDANTRVWFIEPVCDRLQDGCIEAIMQLGTFPLPMNNAPCIVCQEPRTSHDPLYVRVLDLFYGGPGVTWTLTVWLDEKHNLHSSDIVPFRWFVAQIDGQWKPFAFKDPFSAEAIFERRAAKYLSKRSRGQPVPGLCTAVDSSYNLLADSLPYHVVATLHFYQCLAAIAVPCGYIVKSKCHTGFGPSNLRNSTRGLEVFNLISANRLYREWKGPATTAVKAHRRRGHVRYLWHHAGINRLMLPSDPLERQTIAMRNDVDKIYVSETWVGDHVQRDGDWTHEILTGRYLIGGPQWLTPCDAKKRRERDAERN